MADGASKDLNFCWTHDNADLCFDQLGDEERWLFDWCDQMARHASSREGHVKKAAFLGVFV
jgi:hypothetical protein